MRRAATLLAVQEVYTSRSPPLHVLVCANNESSDLHFKPPRCSNQPDYTMLPVLHNAHLGLAVTSAAPSNHSCRSISAAVARFSGTKSSIGRRNWDSARACARTLHVKPIARA